MTKIITAAALILTAILTSTSHAALIDLNAPQIQFETHIQIDTHHPTLDNCDLKILPTFHRNIDIAGNDTMFDRVQPRMVPNPYMADPSFRLPRAQGWETMDA